MAAPAPLPFSTGAALAVGGAASAILPKWDEERAREYEMLASELRTRLAELDAHEADAPADDPGAVNVTLGP